MNNVSEKMFPFVKWVGGKRNIIKNHLAALLPKEINNYYEPFVGGGAMFMYLKNKNAYINDINNELITTYNVIKNDPNKLIKQLTVVKSKHNSEFYYHMREQKPRSNLGIAVRFIYLNKTCFNGLYRVNSDGKFNVPFNGVSKEKLNLFDKDNILNISSYMNNNNVKIFNEDYLEFLNKPKKGDFIFVDSPYDYEIGVKGFDAYNKSCFGQNNQILLANKLKELNDKGVKFMATNHSTKLIRNLYKDFKIIDIKTNRSINSNAKKRKLSANELVIINYDI